jgi:hypothetical protein
MDKVVCFLTDLQVFIPDGLETSGTDEQRCSKSVVLELEDDGSCCGSLPRVGNCATWVW